MLSKKITLALASIGTGLFILSLFAEELGLCGLVATSCQDFFDPIAEIVSIFLVALLLISILYFLHDEIYQSWFRFARWWIPLSMLLIFISPEYPTNIYDPIQKGSVAFVMSGAFVVISIITIAIKYFSLKRTR